MVLAISEQRSYPRQISRHSGQERERGRSRTPKPMAIALELRRDELVRRARMANNPASPTPPLPSPVPVVTKPPARYPPAKGKSPDRSIPGAIELAIQEAHARGDLRQCLQWVLEMQGIYLEWDDPRLDTATEDDLCFSEQTGMGEDATPQERERAKAYWAMVKAEEDEKQCLWEMNATPEEKEAARRLRARYEEMQRKREERVQFFRAPRKDKDFCGSASTSSITPTQPSTLSLSRSLDSALPRTHVIPRTTRSQPQALFPLDEIELIEVRSMWLDQGRKGFPIVETLVCQAVEPSPAKSKETPQAASSVGDATSSTSLSSSAPSALFSSVTTIASTATSVSKTTCPETKSQVSKSPSPVKPIVPSVLGTQTPSVTTAVATPKLITVSTSESPLHNHVAHIALQKALQKERGNHPTLSVMPRRDRTTPRRSRTVSESWLVKGGRTVEGFVHLVGRLPSAYLPREPPLHRTSSCPPSPSSVIAVPYHIPQAESQSETLIYLLPLRPPVHERIFPPLPTLPRSPYRPLTPPLKPTCRSRYVPNPQFLRLKALQNRVLWRLVPVSPSECDFLATVTQRHRSDVCSGRPDVDRLGQMFTAREALLRVSVEGIGMSKLRYGVSAEAAKSSHPGLWRRLCRSGDV